MDALTIQNSAALLPGEELHNRVRAAFIAKGSNLETWCRDNGVSHPTARYALLRATRGKKSLRVRAAILKSVGIAA